MSGTPRLGTIQALRWVAASLVVLLHGYNAYLKYHPDTLIPLQPLFDKFGVIGVDLFFVISGFIMAYTAGSKPPLAFLRHRAIRVLPMYWLYTTLIVALLLFVPGAFSQLRLLPWHTAASYLLLPAANVNHEIVPLLNVGWTLSYEMYFYLVFAAGLWLAPRAILLFLCAALGGSVLAGLLLAPSNIYLALITSPLLLHFLLGATAGAAFRQKRISLPFAACLLPLGIAWLGVSMYLPYVPFNDPLIWRVLRWGIGAGLLLLALATLEREGKCSAPSWMVALGNSSYSLYLCHLPLIAALGKATGTAFSFPVWMVLSYGVAVGAGHLSYRLLEKPLTRYLHQRMAISTLNRRTARA